MTDEEVSKRLARLAEFSEMGASGKPCTHVVIGEFTAVDDGEDAELPFTHRVAFKCAKGAGHEPYHGDGCGLTWDDLGRLVRPAEERTPPGRTTLGWQVAPAGAGRPFPGYTTAELGELAQHGETLAEAYQRLTSTDAETIRNPEVDG